MMPDVVGVDPSLSCTGIAQADGKVMTIETSDRLHRIERMMLIAEAVVIETHDVELVVIEHYAFGAQGQAITKLAELGGILRFGLMTRRVPWVEVPSTVVKKYATGRGNVNKHGVLVAARERLGYVGLSDDEADALWLRAIGLELLGDAPVPLPMVNRSAIAGLQVIQ